MPFVGRLTELRELQQLKRRWRAISLAGPGGIGKSRLARQLVDQSAIAAGNRYIVDLDELPPDASVWDAVGRALGVAGHRKDQICYQLADRDVLLVLDNFDPRIGECAEIASDLLRRHAGLQLLTSGREPLGLDGELVWTVPALTLPVSDSLHFDQAASTDAVRLFITCLFAHQPRVAVTPQNAGAVVRACRLAGGSPLLIAALAARAARKGLRRVTSHMDPAYLLDADDPDQSLARHRSLRASLDWDYAFLSQVERMLLLRLTVFAGSWTLEAAEAVCADAQMATAEVGVCLGRLATRSLVLVDRATDPPRYQMADVVRAYAREKLHSVDRWILQRRYAQYVIATGTRLPPASLGGGAAEPDVEHDNLLAALSTALDQRTAHIAFELGAVGYALWSRRSLFAEGRAWLGRLLELAAPPETTRAWARIACYAGHLAFLDGDIEAAHRLADAALARDPCIASFARYVQSLAAVSRGDVATAAMLAETSERELGSMPEGDDLTRMLELAVPLARARIALEQDNAGVAEDFVTRVVRRARAIENRYWFARALPTQALIASRRRHPELARWLVQQATAILSVDGDADGLVDSLCALGEIELSVGAFPASLEAFHQAFELAAGAGLRLGQLRALDGLACATAVADPHAALRLAEASNALRTRTGALLSPAHRRRLLHWLLRGLGRPLPNESLSARAAGHPWTWAEVVDVVRELPRPEADERATSPEMLTPREREVAGLITQGLSNPQIATRLSISVGTVRAHVEHILLKLGVHSRAQVVHWALHEPRTA